MAKDDLFNEEEGMVRMTFGEHLEDLRRRLLLSLIMVVPCTILGFFLGDWLVEEMSRPVKNALTSYYADRRKEKLSALELARKAEEDGLLPADKKIKREPILLYVERESLRQAIRRAFPELNLPESPPQESAQDTSQNAAPAGTGSVPAPKNSPGSDLQAAPGKTDKIKIIAEVDHDEMQVAAEDEFNRNAYITLGPQEGFMAYMKVSIVAGLVMASWWIIYQLWQFVAEGLYKHERKVVYRAMPLSAALFIVGVLFCFFIVLPVVLNFFFGINKWLKIEPNIRLSEWLGFATILPLIFGVCFELPLVMLVLESIGIFKVEDYMSKWRHAILIISILAMIVTPTTDPGSMMLLMGPMAGLYFAGIGLVQMRRGGLRALSPTARLRAAVGIIVTLYLIGVSVGFAFPPGWQEENWWLEEVWKPGTWPTSWLFRSQLEQPSPNWKWGVTLGNAFVLGLVLLRAGELLLRMRKPGAKK